MIAFKIAFRNLLRNKERTLLSLLMIISSMTGLVLFKSFTDDTMRVLENISTEMHFGHFQLAKKNYWNNANSSHKEQIIENPSELIKKFSDIPGIKSVSGRMQSFGMISLNGETVNSSLLGFDLSNEENMKKSLKILNGTYFSNGSSSEILIGHLLANRLGVKQGDEVTVVTNTVDGVINAKDFKVNGFFAAGTDEIDKYFAYIKLEDMQELLQTSGVDLLMFRMLPNMNLSDLKTTLINASEQTSKDYQVRDWIELSELFRKVRQFYDLQNLIIRLILIFIVVLGILNTVGMSIMERIGEIGTKLSLGTSKSFIYTMFLTETFFLSFAGVLCGSLCAFILGSMVNSAGIYTEIPGASMPIKIQFLFTAKAFLQAGVLISITTILSSIAPVSKALKMTIVEALRRNV